MRDIDEALVLAVAQQDVGRAKELIEQGADPATGNSLSLKTALMGTDPELADLMVLHGARVWNAVLGLQARPIRNEMSERIGIWLALDQIYRGKERQPARQMDEDAFRVLYGDCKTLADLQAARYGQKRTGLTLAASAGLIEEVLAFSLPDPDDRLPSAAFFARDGYGHSVVDVLSPIWMNDKAVAESLLPLFNEKFWQGRESEMLKLWEGMPDRAKPHLECVPAVRHRRNLARLEGLKQGRRRGPGV